jgi:oligopeptide/dipeptide ABC transporter ATP-binding protein
MESVLDVQDLTVGYDSGLRPPVTAVNGVGFNLAAGEAIGILGESGCGKSTLALALPGLLPSNAYIQRGSILFRGVDLRTLTERQLQKIRGAGISLVHQEPALALNPVLRVGHQVAEVLRAHKSISSRQARDEARGLLAQVGLAAESRIDEAYPHQLSGGQRQRVVIAQAIACQPALLIADEPTTALDMAVQVEILALLRNLQQKLNLAMILISHDPALLTHLVHRILVMYAGRVVEAGPTQDLLQKPFHPYTQGLLGCRLATATGDLQGRLLAAIPGEPPNILSLPKGCAFAPRCPARMEVCDTRSPDETMPENGRRVRCFKYEERA